MTHPCTPPGTFYVEKAEGGGDQPHVPEVPSPGGDNCSDHEKNILSVGANDNKFVEDGQHVDDGKQVDDGKFVDDG